LGLFLQKKRKEKKEKSEKKKKLEPQLSY